MKKQKRFLGIKEQLFRGYIVPMTAILVVFAIVVTIVSTRAISSEMRSYYEKTSAQFNMVLDEYIKRMDDGILNLYESTEVSEYLRNAMVGNKSKNAELKEPVYEQLKEMLDFDSGIYSTSVVTLDGERLTYSRNGYERVATSFTKENYYDALKNSNGDTQIFLKQKTNYSFTTEEEVFVICKKFLDDGEGGNPDAVAYTGYIVIECDIVTLQNFYNSAYIEQGGYAVVLDKHNQLIYSNFERNPSKTMIEDMMHAEDASPVRVNGQKMYVVSNLSELSGATVIGLIPVEEIAENSSRTIFLFAILFLVCFVLIFILSQRFSDSYTKPIKALCAAMSKFRKGDLDTSIEVTHQNEFGDLERDFNKLTRDVKTLTTTVVDAEKKLHEIGIKSLYGQIEPHFLYNTLDAIRSLAVINDDNSTADAIVSLANLFRYNSSVKSDFVTVRVEVSNIRNYIDLQKLCYSKKFDFEIRADESVMDLEIMRFSLQPIVENAILHGFKNVRRGGMLDISIQKHGNILRFEVRDNGCGIEREELESLRSAVGNKENQGAHIGLRNIHERLQLYFGDEYGLHIESDGENGTTVWFEVPYHEDHTLKMSSEARYFENRGGEDRV